MLPGAIVAPDEKVTVVCPASADAVPTHDPVTLGSGLAALTIPAGYASVNALVNVAVNSACVLVMVMVRSAVPFDGTLLGLNDLATVGRAGLTVSVSPAEQTPADVQDDDVLLLLTVDGGVMVAMLVTDVCPHAMDVPSSTDMASTNKARSRLAYAAICV